MSLKPLGQEIEVQVEATVYPSENLDKVKKAIENILPKVSVSLEELNPSYFRGTTHGEECLTRIYSQLRNRATLGVARRLLLANATHRSTWLYLNKQAAFMGVVAICEEDSESPLGPVRVTISSENIREFIDWLAPEVHA